MSDQKRRILQRASEDVEARARLLSEELRANEVALEWVALAAELGLPEARLALASEEPVVDWADERARKRTLRAAGKLRGRPFLSWVAADWVLHLHADEPLVQEAARVAKEWALNALPAEGARPTLKAARKAVRALDDRGVQVDLSGLVVGTTRSTPSAASAASDFVKSVRDARGIDVESELKWQRLRLAECLVGSEPAVRDLVAGR